MKPLLLIFMMTLASPAFSQAIVGSSVVDGVLVDLFDDGTWRAQQTRKPGCLAIDTEISFCSTDPAWKMTRKSTAEVAATLRHDDRHYGQFIIEKVGTADGLTLESLRDLVLEIATSAEGVKPSVVEVTQTKVAGLPAEILVYVVSLNGTDFLFANTLVLTEHRTMQIQTWQLGGIPYTEEHRALHTGVETATQIAEPKQ